MEKPPPFNRGKSADFGTKAVVPPQRFIAIYIYLNFFYLVITIWLNSIYIYVIVFWYILASVLFNRWSTGQIRPDMGFQVLAKLIV